MTAANPGAKRATVRAGVAFLITAGCGLGLAVVYWRGGQPQVEGALLGTAFGALGYGLVEWAKHLMPQGPYVEMRETLPTTDQDRAAFATDLERGGVIGRRPALVRLLYLAGASLGVAALFPIRSLGPRPSKASLHTGWRGGKRAVNENGVPISAADVPMDGLVTVFPEDDDDPSSGQAVLIRVPAGVIKPEPGREHWTPGGLIAYSKVCTHAGCPVGLYQTSTRTLLCPCHQSVFDVVRGGRPRTGPAAWPLPQLPLAVDSEGFVRSTGDFSSPVGPGWWKS